MHISVYQCVCISAVHQMYISKRLYNTLYLLQSSQYCSLLRLRHWRL